MSILCSRGSAIIEFAVLVPLCISLVFGVVDYGFQNKEYGLMLEAARAGARAAALAETSEPAERANIAGFTATQFLSNAQLNINSYAIHVQQHDLLASIGTIPAVEVIISSVGRSPFVFLPVNAFPKCAKSLFALPKGGSVNSHGAEPLAECSR